MASSPLSYSPTNSVDLNSYSSLFATKSVDMPSNSDVPETSLTPEQASIQSSIQSFQSSVIASIAASRTGGSVAASTTLSTSTTATSLSSNTASVTSSANASSQSGTNSSPTSGSGASSSSTAGTSSAASNNSASDLQKESSVMSKPGMQAAVAVPVVVAVLAIIALIFFFMRRRKRRGQQTDDMVEKQSPAIARKKKWTRHLRVFSFDTELLMGGRYSSTNSIRSRQTGSQRSGNRSQHSGSPSVHSIDEVAPPYRDTVHNVQPSIGQVMTGAVAGGAAAAGVTRSLSTATAPPPYGAAAPRLDAPSPTTPASQHSNRNPFADSPPVSPVDASPFNDPPGTSPIVSRNSSLYRSDRDDASTIGDAASIHEATVARNQSVRSGGRVIQNIGGGSQ